MQTPDPPEIHRHLRSIDAVPNRSAGAGSAQGQPLAARVKGVARYRADPIRAGTTQRHLSFLERGRSAPGRGLVVRLAESLELPLRDRNKLLASAGYLPAYPQTPLGDPSVSAVYEAMCQILVAPDRPDVQVGIERAEGPRAGQSVTVRPRCRPSRPRPPSAGLTHEPIKRGPSPAGPSTSTSAPHITPGQRR